MIDGWLNIEISTLFNLKGGLGVIGHQSYLLGHEGGQMWLQEKQNYKCDIYCQNLHVRCKYELSNSKYLGHPKYVETFLKVKPSKYGL